VKPRPYQIAAKAGAYDALREARSAIVVMPTGTGKTVLFADIAADHVKAKRRVLVLAHREELLDQAAEKIGAMAGCAVAIEQGQRRQATSSSPVVIASVLSMIRRLDRFPSDAFDLVIVDECHHALAQTYLTLLDHFAGAKVLGFTATPNRGDEKALAQVFERVAFDMTIGDAIADGWLVPITTESIDVESLDLASIGKQSGDFAGGELAEALSQIDALREAVEPAVEIAGDMQAIVFCVTVKHMHLVAETALQVAEERALELTVATIEGGTPKDRRRKIMADFKAGRVRWLINVGVATEGFDAPAVEAVIFMRPTLSHALYLQMGGRGTRPLPGIVDGFDTAAGRRAAIGRSDKPRTMWIDLVGNAGKHDIVSAMDLLGGDYSLPEQREAKALLEDGEADDLLEALAMAREARAGELTERRARAGDPFALFGIVPSKDRWGRDPTKLQKRVIDALRSPRPIADWREANMLCTELARRDREDLCLYSQAALLARRGHEIAPLRSMTRREAADLIRPMAVGWGSSRARRR
jgi:superfamily II DNA or RNA helicase